MNNEIQDFLKEFFSSSAGGLLRTFLEEQEAMGRSVSKETLEREVEELLSSEEGLMELVQKGLDNTQLASAEGFDQLLAKARSDEPISEEDVRLGKLDAWGDGEWMIEPDRVQVDYRGVECEILRNSMGALCGYVTVPEGHEWHGKHYDEIECEVHGGLTFGQQMPWGSSEKEEYVIGFDCAHFRDITPSCEKLLAEQRKKFPRPESSRGLLEEGPFTPIYKNIAYVRGEIESLVDQMLDGVKDG